jgi:hypothetical protein
MTDTDTLRLDSIRKAIVRSQQVFELSDKGYDNDNA